MKNMTTKISEKHKAKSETKKVLLANLLQLKYQIEDYVKDPLHPIYKYKSSFSHFLRKYLKILDIKNKDFASDISISETALSQLINAHRKPNKIILIRLGIHSNEIISLLNWFDLDSKDRGRRLANLYRIRKQAKRVKNRPQISI